MGTKIIAKSVKSKAKFELEKVKPIAHVDKAFIPALFAHAIDDDFILPSHSEALHEAYAGDKNYITFEGDHNSERPQFFLDSVVIFFLNSLQVHELVPQSKRKYDTPSSAVPSLSIYFGDDDGEDYGSMGNDITEEDLIKMAIEQSMQTHKEENERKQDGNGEEHKNDEQTENEYLANAFSLLDFKK